MAALVEICVDEDTTPQDKRADGEVRFWVGRKHGVVHDNIEPELSTKWLDPHTTATQSYRVMVDRTRWKENMAGTRSECQWVDMRSMPRPNQTHFAFGEPLWYGGRYCFLDDFPGPGRLC